MNCCFTHKHVLHGAVSIAIGCLCVNTAVGDFDEGGGSFHTNQDGLPVDPHTNQDGTRPVPEFRVFDPDVPGFDLSRRSDLPVFDWESIETPVVFDLSGPIDETPPWGNVDIPELLERQSTKAAGLPGDPPLHGMFSFEDTLKRMSWRNTRPGGEGASGGSAPAFPAMPIPAPGALMLLGVGAAFLRRSRTRT